MCKPYWEWEQWLKRKNPTLPKRWTPFSEKALKLMKKTLTPRVKDRWTAKDMRKCIAKEKLLKPVKSDDDDVFVYVPSEFVRVSGVHYSNTLPLCTNHTRVEHMPRSLDDGVHIDLHWYDVSAFLPRLLAH
ncbi:hypothetical protein GCK32_019450 [Trichostrongylus colubriformis]|uniref:Uncharacterized protein n=1 Tax=Trichostrongylus colubriformis TaxID=6319 RepID=A0AAN8FDN7_TRICO